MSHQGPFYVYVLRSLADRERYIGLSGNVSSRVRQHNAGKVKSTRARVPFVVMHQQSYQTLAEARAREKYLKTAAGRRWLDKNGWWVGGSPPPPGRPCPTTSFKRVSGRTGERPTRASISFGRAGTPFRRTRLMENWKNAEVENFNYPVSHFCIF